MAWLPGPRVGCVSMLSTAGSMSLGTGSSRGSHLVVDEDEGVVRVFTRMLLVLLTWAAVRQHATEGDSSRDDGSNKCKVVCDVRKGSTA